MPKTTETRTFVVGEKTDHPSAGYYVKLDKNDYVVRVASWGIDPIVNKKTDDLLESAKTEVKKTEAKKGAAKKGAAKAPKSK